MKKMYLNDKKHIAIDIGTSKTRIYIEGIGMVFNESTLLIVDEKTKKIVAVGDDAKKMVGKLSGSLMVQYPMKNGVIADIRILTLFISVVLRKYEKELQEGFVTLACPISVTEIERRALINTVKKLGAIFVHVEDDIKLALLGAGVDVTKPQAVLGLDIGAGKAVCGVVASDGVLSSRWSKAAGNAIDNELVKAIKTKYNTSIGEVSAEKIKIEVGTVVKTKTPLKTKAYGYDLVSGMPKDVVITDEEVSKVIQSVFGNLTNLITGVLEETPNELAGDVIKNGIVITGGLAGVVGTKFYFEEFFQIPARVPKNHLNAVIDGAIAHRELTIKEYEWITDKSPSDF